MIPKINQDLESSRHQRNMTKTQKRNDTYIKEGVIVNSFVKEPLADEENQAQFTPLDETYDTLIISGSNIDLPKRGEIHFDGRKICILDHGIKCG